MIQITRKVAHSKNSRTGCPPDELRFWGLDVLGLFERYWARMGIQVVRPGTTRIERVGPQLYLLIGDSDLVFFDLKPVINRLNWLKPRAVRVRLTDQQEDQYREVVLTDASRCLRSIERSYEHSRSRTTRIWLTPDTMLARAWAEAKSAHEGHLHMRHASSADLRGQHMVLPGLSLNTGSEQVAGDAILYIQSHWRRGLNECIEGIYEYAPGVWIHESVRPAPEVHLIGPLWIGAGTSLDCSATLIGPGGVPDQCRPQPSPSPFAWNEARLPNWTLRAQARVHHRRQFGKRLFDLVFSILALVMTLPLYPVIALAILIEDGRPVIFAHRRQTRHGREFSCYKFRTMCRNAEHLKEDLQAHNHCDGPQFYIKNDPRLLRIGRLLRRFQIDEIPQFWNVLRGDMSIVGPRPSPDRENQFCPTWREARLSIRPGVTGLWQIQRTRKPQTDFQEWIRYDLEYVQRRSWRLDLWIIWRTIRQALFAKASQQ